jgi:hypothetical protein
MKQETTKIVLLLVIAGIIIYALVAMQPQPALAPATPTSSPAGIMSPATSPTPDTRELEQGGSSYLDSQGVYSFLYPNNYTLDAPNNDPHVRIYKRGESQRPQSEMSDGVLIALETISLENKSLSSWVDTQIQEATQNQASEVVRAKTTTSLNGYPGYTYEISGLGSSTYTVIQKDPTSPYALSITYLVADPTQKDYQQEVEKILATIKLIK